MSQRNINIIYYLTKEFIEKRRVILEAMKTNIETNCKPKLKDVYKLIK